MSDTSVTTETPTPAPVIPMPNDQAARSPTGEILEPAQIAAAQAAQTTPKAGDPPATTSTSPAKADAPTGAPDTYTAFTVPDGYTLDPKVTEAFTPIAKELGLSQEAAQRLVNFHTDQMIAAAKAPAAAYETTRTQWKAQVESDPDIRSAVADGKTGIEAVKVGIARALNSLGDAKLASDFKAAMDLTGAGDNPAFIKAVWKWSSLITEGKHVAGGGPSIHGQTPTGQVERPPAAKSLYPNLS